MSLINIRERYEADQGPLALAGLNRKELARQLVLDFRLVLRRRVLED